MEIIFFGNLHFLQTDYTHNTDFPSTREKGKKTYLEENTYSEEYTNLEEKANSKKVSKDNYQYALSRTRMRRSNEKFNKSLDSLLKTLSESLENSTMDSGVAVLNESNLVGNMHDDEDRCQRWLDTREKIEAIFPGKRLFTLHLLR